MEARYTEHYRELYRRHWWWRAREGFVWSVLQGLGRRPEGETILDVGCGDALFFDRLSALGTVEGVEPHAPVSESTFTIHRCAFDERFRPATRYSLILMLDVLEHLDDPVRALSHALSLLEPDGSLVITVPAFPALWTEHDVINEHRLRYTKRSLRAAADQAGLELSALRYFFHWAFAAKLAVRLKETLTPPRAAHETVPPAPINALLLGAALIEQRLLRNVPLPFGSSLLAVGGHPGRAASGLDQASSGSRP